MQSEMSCHIGMRGRHFCRICYVKGHEVEDADSNRSNNNSNGMVVESVPRGDSDVESVASSVGSPEPEEDTIIPNGDEGNVVQTSP